MTRNHYDTIVIGGGVIGLACAYYLNLAGQHVCVVEQNTVGSGASHANCGLVFTSDLVPLCSPGAVSSEVIRMLKGTSPLYIKPGLDIGRFLWLLKFAGKCNPAHLDRAVIARDAILRTSRLLFDQLLEEGRIDCEWEEKGVLMVYKDEKMMEKYAATNRILKPYDLDATALVGSTLNDFEPALRDDVYGAWHHRVDTHLRPDALMRSWAKTVTDMGVKIVEHCPMEGFIADRGSISGIRTPADNYTADHFVLAAGAWSPLPAREIGLRIPIQPGKGYSITMSRPGICPKTPCYLYERSVVATPWPSGFRLGGTMEYSGFNDRLIPQRIEKLKQGAAEYLREPLGRSISEEWVAMRPMTYDDMPIIGRAPGRRNLYLATGHGMLGITTAPGTGKLIAEMIQGEDTHIDTSAFSPGRF